VLLVFVVVSTTLRYLTRGMYLHEMLPESFHAELENQLSTASYYWSSQWPFIEESAKHFQLHWQFSQVVGMLPLTGRCDKNVFFDMVCMRMQMFTESLERYGRDDYRIEKDHCAMLSWLRMNNLNHSHYFGEWHTLESIIDDVQSGKAWESPTHWPIDIKACQLKPPGMQGHLNVPSREWGVEHSQEVIDWLTAKWAQPCYDNHKPWTDLAKTLSPTLKPAFAMVSNKPLAAQGGEDLDFVVMVDVIFGRAYSALRVIGMHVFLRGKDDAVEIHNAWGWRSVLYSHRIVKSTFNDMWVVEENHMSCVWDLAERVAKIMGADQVRVDIALTKGRPMDCLVWELTLTSNLGAPAHMRYVAKSWVLGHTNRLYSVFGNETSKPVYLQTKDDVPGQ